MLRGHGAVLHGTVPLRFQRRNLKQEVCGHGAVPMQGTVPLRRQRCGVLEQEVCGHGAVPLDRTVPLRRV